jgi:protease-4
LSDEEIRMRHGLPLLFLAICVVGGLWIGEILAPKPLVVWVPIDSDLDNVSTRIILEQLETLRQDRQVAGVVLAIDSYGGNVESGEQVHYSILRLRQEKPVVGAVQSRALSSAYMVAVATAPLYATSASSVGNVGTRIIRPGDAYFMTNEIYTGPYKLTGGSRFDHIRQLELITENFAALVDFQRKQAERPLQIDMAVLTQAKIYTGNEGWSLGLVDRIGGLADATESAAALAGIRSYVMVSYDSYQTSAPWWKKIVQFQPEQLSGIIGEQPVSLSTSTASE